MDIRIVAPARWITEEVAEAAMALAGDGEKITIDPQCFERDGRLAGSDALRADALARALGEADIVWAARGGYGSMRVLPHIDRGLETDAILLGYSDICALQFGLLGADVLSVHGAMPSDILSGGADGPRAALDLAVRLARQAGPPERCLGLTPVVEGEARGVVYTANLAVLCALIGTPFEPDLSDAILIVEETGEHPYAVDRLFWRLAQSRLAQRIKALVLGDFDLLTDDDIIWAESVAEMARRHFPGRPIASGAPIGHGETNEPVAQGEIGFLTVGCDAELILSSNKQKTGT